jgi:hypothetical protein
MKLTPEHGDRYLEDGVYDLTGVEVLHFQTDHGDHAEFDDATVLPFLAKYPNWVVGHAYQTYDCFFL